MHSLRAKSILLVSLFIIFAAYSSVYADITVSINYYGQDHYGYEASSVNAKAGDTYSLHVVNHSGGSINWKWTWLGPQDQGVWLTSIGSKNVDARFIPFNTNNWLYTFTVEIWKTGEGEGGGPHTIDGSGAINQPDITITEPVVDKYVAKDSETTVSVTATVGHGEEGWANQPVTIWILKNGTGSPLYSHNLTTGDSGTATYQYSPGSWDTAEYETRAKINDPIKTYVDEGNYAITVFKTEVTHVKFDHTAGDTADGINIRENNSTDISVPEWVKGGQNKPAAYKKSTSVTIKTRFTVSPSSVTSAKIQATTSDSILGNLGEQTVSFSSGVSSPEYISFTPTSSTPSSIDKDTVTWQWKVNDVNGSSSSEVDINTSGAHTIYTVLGTPQSPMTEPWTQVLDYACVWANGKTSESAAVTPITTNAYNNLGKNYYGQNTHAAGTTFNLTSFLSANWADCRDMSATVHVFTRAIGGTTTNVRKIDGPFDYKSIDPVGLPGWDTGAWNFHQVGNYSGVYDACLRLKQSNPRIPTGEDINGSYKTDLYDSGTWDPKAPFNYTTVN